MNIVNLTPHEINILEETDDGGYTEQARPDQVKNSAGGFVFEVDAWTRLDRFLILGSEKGTYYVSPEDLTKENAENVIAAIRMDGERAVNRIAEVSLSGRAVKNEPALFALALACAAKNIDTRRLALNAIPSVCRIGTHLFNFVSYCEAMRGWGRGMREGVAKWYNDMDIEKLSYQVIKYRQRNGWSHKDVLRLCHANPKTSDTPQEKSDLYQWITHDNPPESPTGILSGFLKVQQAKNAKKAALLTWEYKLPREAIPTRFLKEPEIWQALMDNGMPLHAMVRNLGNMSAMDMFSLKNEDKYTSMVIDALEDDAYIRKSRMHPMQLHVAHKTYSSGSGGRESNSWTPNQAISSALERAFYKSFDNVVTSGKKILLSIDVSGSMRMAYASGMPTSCIEAAAVMAMAIARTERNHKINAFDTKIKQVNIGAESSLSYAANQIRSLISGGTDCTLPIFDARRSGRFYDAIVILTDSETWAYNHPFKEMKLYRDKVNPQAKLVVVQMVANRYTVAELEDPGSMTCVGMDIAVPSIISEFLRS